ncbi:CBS domain-containing protein [Aeoliella sp. ICT_H6.2]|uniref:CBS domain-containing protein n=1 Tax=Aeoliella straminimaris TaxID=2954799 RepID=A0A9X2FFA4_9BACT|nr:CBS domain-containing protein [Aeoliella straminimaris]MCO6047679.1 CBS domain-containing protein [Aeoliella straminimaris]
MTLHSIGTLQVDTISPSDSVQIAAARMRDHLVGCLVVCDESHRPVGIVTDRDLATRVVARGLDSTEVRVVDVMTAAPQCVRPCDRDDEILRVMQGVPCRRAPVVDEQGRLVALVTLDDVVSVMGRRLGLIGSLVHRESPAVLDSGGI